MTLYMKTATRRRMVEAQRAMLSPLAYDDFESWQLDVNQHVRDLVGADHVVAFLFDERGVGYFSNDTDTAPLDLFRNRFLGYDAFGSATFAPETGRPRGSLFVEQYHRARRAHGSGAMHDMQDLGAAAVKKSEIFQDTHVGIGLEHMMGLGTPLPIGEVTTAIGFERPNAPGYSESGLSLLEMLVPAYEAGVQAWKRSTNFRATFELLDEALVVVGQDGGILFESRTFTDLMRTEPMADAVFKAVEALARRLHLTQSWQGLKAGAANRAVREVNAQRRTYSLWGSPLDPTLFGVEAVLVGIERRKPTLPTTTVARQRFGLTPRQAEVALLIANGLDNSAIAERLFISPHTARRHTERVLKKLGVASRSAVALKLVDRSR